MRAKLETEYVRGAVCTRCATVIPVFPYSGENSQLNDVPLSGEFKCQCPECGAPCTCKADELDVYPKA